MLFRVFAYGVYMETLLEIVVIGGWALGVLFMGFCLLCLGLRMGDFLFSPCLKK